MRHERPRPSAFSQTELTHYLTMRDDDRATTDRSR